jgi:hypothetical protein
LLKPIKFQTFYEIGCLREDSFREVGEGTNESIDLDKYDQYYHHFFYGMRMQRKSLELSDGLRSQTFSQIWNQVSI